MRKKTLWPPCQVSGSRQLTEKRPSWLRKFALQPQEKVLGSPQLLHLISCLARIKNPSSWDPGGLSGRHLEHMLAGCQPLPKTASSVSPRYKQPCIPRLIHLSHIAWDSPLKMFHCRMRMMPLNHQSWTMHLLILEYLRPSIVNAMSLALIQD